MSPPIDDLLRDLTFTHDPETDTLTDSLGDVWRREGAEAPSAAPATTPVAPENMWPQSSLEEVREAQRLADAGDPAYTWQVEPQLASTDDWWGYLDEPGSEVADRFLREVLGWDQYLFRWVRGGDGAAAGVHSGILYWRCVPGEVNPLYPTESCAPTIDDLHYETVSLDLAQLDRRGLDGIWVVSDWRTFEPVAQADPDAAEAEARALLEDFLQARIDGHGAEGLVDVDRSPEVPLLYATTTGAPYERYEIELLDGPHWPDGFMDFKVRLLADGGQTVVEQRLSWLGIGWPVFNLWAPNSTENGQPVALPYEFLGGEVTASAANPWVQNCDADHRPDSQLDCLGWVPGVGFLSLIADPLDLANGCLEDVTAPVTVSLGGIEAQAMDGTLASRAPECDVFAPRWVDRGNPVRLYLIDGRGSSMHTLGVAVVADEAGYEGVRLEAVIAGAAPVIESIQFHPREV